MTLSKESIVSEYLRYTVENKRKYGEKTIVLLQVGSFFEAYGYKEAECICGSNVADVFERILDFKVNPKAKMLHEGKQVYMGGFGISQIEKYVAKIQENGYTIAVYTQNKNEVSTTRSLVEIISPGTFFFDEKGKLSNVTMCIWIEHVKCNCLTPETLVFGVSTIDIYTGTTTLHQMDICYHHNPTTYDNIERLVSIYDPIECIVISNLEEKITNEIINYVGLDQTKNHIIGPSKKNGNEDILKSETRKYQVEFFKRFYPELCEEVVYTALNESHDLAISSFVYLVNFVSKHSPQLTERMTEPVFEEKSDELFLANHSLKQLNILDDARHSGNLRSVGSFLQQCKTMMGKRRFIHNLHHPTRNIQLLNKSYDITSKALKIGLWKEYRNKMYNVGDIEKLKRKFILHRVTPKELATLERDIGTLIKITENHEKDEVYSHITQHGDPQDHLVRISKDLNYIFDFDICGSFDALNFENHCFNNTNFIRKGVSNSIDELRKSSFNSRMLLDSITKCLSDIIAKNEKKGTIFVKLHEFAKSEPLLLATKRRCAILREGITSIGDSEVNVRYCGYDGNEETFAFQLNDLEYFNHGTNKKDEVITSKQIKKITKNLQNSYDKLLFELTSFYDNYIQDFTKHFVSIDIINMFAIEIDILQCKCYIAYTYNYCKPNIVKADKAFCNFTGIKHPLIEHLQTNELYVTNDLSIGEKNVDGVLVYGTNAVGKTSFIKSVGIAVIMAQSGLFVPCETFTYSPYASIFTRILGNDNIFKGLSTFAVEMSELRTILTLSNKDSLIIGDELCSGTESDSALSIFTAGLEILHSNLSTFLFATHFHEIANYDEIKRLSRMKMMHMEVTYHPKSGCLIYDRKLKPGSGSTTYGLEVCKSLNLPLPFLERAYEIRSKYNSTYTSILSETSSHYNSKKIGGMCEICNVLRYTEVHHLQHQENSNERSYIGQIHKNHKANLINICGSCHTKLHMTNTEHKIVKTTDGYIIQEIVK